MDKSVCWGYGPHPGGWAGAVSDCLVRVGVVGRRPFLDGKGNAGAA